MHSGPRRMDIACVRPDLAGPGMRWSYEYRFSRAGTSYESAGTGIGHRPVAVVRRSACGVCGGGCGHRHRGPGRRHSASGGRACRVCVADRCCRAPFSAACGTWHRGCRMAVLRRVSRGAARWPGLARCRQRLAACGLAPDGRSGWQVRFPRPDRALSAAIAGEGLLRASSQAARCVCGESASLSWRALAMASWVL